MKSLPECYLHQGSACDLAQLLNPDLSLTTIHVPGPPSLKTDRHFVYGFHLKRIQMTVPCGLKTFQIKAKIKSLIEIHAYPYEKQTKTSLKADYSAETFVSKNLNDQW